MHRKRIWIIRLLALTCIFHCVCLEYSLVSLLICLLFLFPSFCSRLNKMLDFSFNDKYFKFLSDPLNHFFNFSGNLRIAHLISWNVKSPAKCLRHISAWVLSTLRRHQICVFATGTRALKVWDLIFDPEVSQLSLWAGQFADGEVADRSLGKEDSL